MDEKAIKDHVLRGFIGGIILTIPLLGILFYLSTVFPGIRYLQSPRPQLYTLAILMILFRFLMVKWNLQETGKGLLMFTFLAMILFLINLKYNFISL